jgi:soluble lytic murein transglycosylase-like protein
MKINKNVASQIFVGLGLFSCVTPEPGPVIDITVVPAYVDAIDEDFKAQKLRLTKLIKGHSDWEKYSGSLQLALAAKEKILLKEWDLAQEIWLDVLQLEERNLGRLAFHSWIDAYANILGAQTSPEMLARLLLAETDDGKNSEYLKTQGLDNEDKLILAISEHLGSGPLEAEISSVTEEINPSKTPIPEGDPLLKSLSESYCRIKSKSLDAWTAWIKLLTPGQKNYWQALVAECEGASETVISHLEQALAQLPKEQGNEGFVIASASMLVNAYRSVGNREAMAKTFLKLTNFYESPELEASQLGLDAFDFEYDRVNQIIWSARYQALLGDYLTAKDHVQRAFSWLERAYGIAGSNGERLKLDGLRAEGYHVLAYRISYEQGDFDAAISQSLLGLEKSNRLASWVTRFKWYAGWYEYRATRYANAISYWQQLEGLKAADYMQSQVLFWIADAYHRLDQAQKRDTYVKELCKNEPLSFYALVGLGKVRWDAPDCKAIGHGLDFSADTPKEDLLKQYAFTLEPLRRNKNIAGYLYKAELALAAELKDLDQLTGKDLYRELIKRIQPSKNVDAYVYASRLMHGAGLYNLGISLSYDASLAEPEIWSTYTDQVQVYFPRPFEQVVTRIASRFKVEPSLIFGIGRQESAFRVDAVSPAGALGLLQLMPATASRYQEVLNKQFQNGNFDLFDPETNLSLGSAYLGKLSAHYQSNAPYLIAAYNAGEFVVDIWKARRFHEDPLVWIEGIPFGETRNYVKNVMRNKAVYDALMR